MSIEPHPQLIRFGFEDSDLYITPLHIAALENSVEKVRALLEQGFNPFIKTVDSKPRTPYEYALKFDCMKAAAVLREYMNENPHLALEVLNLD